MLKEIEIIHLKIAQCHICPKMDKLKKVRNPLSVGKNTSVFILSQSLAESQLRKSGVNFFKEDGSLGSTGKQLEKFLNKINQTVFPPHDIRLDEGIVISKRKPDFHSVLQQTIYKYILKQRNDKSITDLINESISTNSIPKINFANLDIGFLPIQHASGANPLYNKMIKNDAFINLINNYLKS